MEIESFILTAISLSTLFIVGVIYLWAVVKKDLRPNLPSILIWVITATVTAVSYLFISDWNWLTSILIIGNAVKAVVIFLVVLLRRQFASVNSFDKNFYFPAAVVLVLFWVFLGLGAGHLILQAIVLWGFFPIVIGIVKGDVKEYWLSWLLAGVAYAINLAVILLGVFDPIELVAPLVLFLGNIGVYLAITWKTKR